MNYYWLQVGFNRGDDVEYYIHPLSLDESIRRIYQQSYVDVRGRWLYRVDGLAVRHPGACEQSSLPSAGM